MSSEISKLYIELTAKTDAFKKEMTAAEKKGEGAGTAIQSYLTKFGPAMAVAAVAAVAAVGIELLKMGMEFEASEVKIQQMTGQTAEQVQTLGDAFLQSSAMGAQSAQEVIDAYAPVSGQLQSVEGHVLSVAEATRFMSEATTLAEATGGQLKETTAALTTIMQAYQIPLEDVAAATDTLANLSATTNTPLADLASTVDRLHGKLGPLAPSLQDVSALMLDLTDHGVPAGRAMISAGSAIENLMDPSQGAADELQALGISTFDASGKFVGMHEILGQLHDKLKGATEQQKLLALSQIFGKAQAGDFYNTIEAGSGGLDDATNSLENSTSALDKQKAYLESGGGQWDQFTTGVKNAATGLGQDFARGVIATADVFRDRLVPALKGATAEVGDFLGAIGRFTSGAQDTSALNLVASFEKAGQAYEAAHTKSSQHLHQIDNTYYEGRKDLGDRDVATAIQQDQQKEAAHRSQLDGEASAAVSHWDAIHSIYKDGSAQSAAAIADMSDRERETIEYLQLVAQQSGLTWDQMKTGANGALHAQIMVNGQLITVHGTYGDVLSQIDAAKAKQKELADQAKSLAAMNAILAGLKGSWGNLADSIWGASNAADHFKSVGGKPMGHAAFGATNVGGSFLVGENGPEIVNLPRGSDVIPNTRLSGARSSSVSITVGAITITASSDPRGTARAVREALLDLARESGTSSILGAYA